MRRIILLLFMLFPTIALAGTHWVSPTGAAAWGASLGTGCNSATPLSGTSACSLTTANANAAAGDVVNLRAGTYSAGILPSNSGTGTSLPANMITFQGYMSEVANIAPSGDYLDVTGLSYIRILHLTFTKTTNNVGRIEAGANHIELAFNVFNSTNGWNMNLNLDAQSGHLWVTHNWIHDNTFNTSGSAHGNSIGCTDNGGDTMDIGVASPTFGQTFDDDNNNTVENNVFNHAPHSALDQYGRFNVYRNNVLHNEPWSSGCTSFSYQPTYTNAAYNGLFGHRVWQVTNDYVSRFQLDILVEGNRMGYASPNDSNDGVDNFDLAAGGVIMRYNFSYASMGNGLDFKYAFNGGNGNGGNGGTYNRVYNNTLYNNGIGWPDGYNASCTAGSCPLAGGASVLYAGSASGVGNVYKNNLIYLSNGITLYSFDVLDKNQNIGVNPGTSGWAEITTVANNWCTSSQTSLGGCVAFGDPKFTNPDITNPASTTLPDLSLQATSGAIDQGTFLTTATNGGTGSTSLTVADALYFQDGTWGSDLAKASAGLGGTFQADWIAIGTISNVVQVSSITYGAYNAPAGTITLASPMTWSNGAHIWLYKKSDGAVVLNGAAPDLGASESGSAPSPPSILTITLAQGRVAVPYTTTLSATSGTPPYTWTMMPGVPGLALGTSTGVLAGDPSNDGMYSLTFTVTDSLSQTGMTTLPLIIAPPETDIGVF